MKDVSLGFANSYDSGFYPHISVNNNGIAVEVHQSKGAGTLWYHVGVLTGCNCQFGGSNQYDSGRTPAVACNDGGVVVEVHQSDGPSTKMWYHVGIVNANTKTVAWGSSINYDSGDNPSVAINNIGIVVEVHKSDGLSTKMWYHVGSVDPNAKTVAWGDSINYDSGSVPSVAINNNGVAVEVHQSDGPSTNLWYHVGVVNSAAKTVAWGSSINYDQGANPSVAITDDGFVIEIHRSEAFDTLWCRTGIVDANSKTITWLTGSRQYDKGSNPAVATNGLLAMAVHQGGSTLWYSASMIADRGTWMQTSLATLGDSTLRQLVMPASHDAGMYELNDCVGALNFGANACNSRTQTLSILGQLQSGSRYFDLRPVLYRGTFRTGHFNDSPVLGCDGPALAVVFEDVSAFLAGSSELVILMFDHYFDRDSGVFAFTDQQMDALCGQVVAQLRPFLYTGPGPLAGTPLRQMIASGGRAIAVFASLSASVKSKYAGQGIYSYSDYPGGPADLTVFDSYANTNDLNTMINDQFGKMKRTENHGGDLFLLSWTLTQSNTQAIACGAGGLTTSILDLAAQADAALWSNIVDQYAAQQITTATIANLLYVDNCQGFVTDVSTWLNRGMHLGATLVGAQNQYLLPGDRLYAVNGQFFLVYQNDGNLVVYNAAARPTWASHTDGKPAWRTYMQPDGDFVIYSAWRNPVWATGTVGRGVRVVMQDDGNLVVDDSSGNPIWKSQDHP
jgi:hypothetical protein